MVNIKSKTFMLVTKLRNNSYEWNIAVVKTVFWLFSGVVLD